MKSRKLFMLMMLASAMLAFAGCDKGGDDLSDDKTENPGDNSDDNNGGNQGEEPGDGPATEVEGGNEYFDLLVFDIKTTTASIDIQPADKEMYYYWNTIEKEYVEDRMMTLDDVVASRLRSIQSIIDMGVGSWIGEREGTRGNLIKGDNTLRDSGLIGNETYYLYVAGVEFKEEMGRVLVGYDESRDKDGDIIRTPIYEERMRMVAYQGTPVASLEFTTNQAVPSSITFQLEFDHGKITILPSNDDPYFFACIESDMFDNMSDAEIIQYFIYSEGGDLSMYTTQGAAMANFGPQMEVGQSYTCYLFGYDGGATTGLFKFEYTFEGVDRFNDYSSLRNNYSFTTAKEPALIRFYGSNDGFANDSNHFYVLIQDTDNMNEFFQSEVFAPLSNGNDPTGTYQVDLSWSGKENTAFSGELDGLFQPLGTWWILPDVYGNAGALAAGDEGTITVTRLGEMTYERADSDPARGIYAYSGDFRIEAEYKCPRGFTVTVFYEGDTTFMDVSGVEESAAANRANLGSLLEFSTIARNTKLSAVPAAIKRVN